MPKLSASEAAAKWGRNTAAAVPDYQAGIRRVNVAPGELAARQTAKYQARVMESIPKWQRKVRAVSLGEWQQAAAEKGAQRLASGVQAAEGKVAGALAPLFSHIEAGERQIASMPSTSFEDNVNRMVTFARHMKRYGQTGGGAGGAGV